jgi:hypothetical protein
LLPPSLSIFRGYSTNSGIGELPTARPGSLRGEQYLHADPELWADENVANAARKWMILYDDQRIAAMSHKLGDSIEAWSYFGCGDLRFVVRLVGAGSFDSRLAYFSHAQAWRARDFHNGDDPGALLGVSKAFHPAWKDGEPFQPIAPVQPAADWKKVVESQHKMAARLVAYLYRACVTQVPLVVGVPFREFVSGGGLHKLVSFARAALPLDLKRDCRIRIFTGRPEPYLNELMAHLVVVPEELASAALSARPDAALMDFSGALKAGEEVDQGYSAYGKEVVERALKFPDSLLAFASRFQTCNEEAPGATAAASVSMVYNLAHAGGDPAKLQGLFRFLAEEAKQRNEVRDWKMIQPREWKQLSSDLLLETALMPRCTEDLRALQRCVKKELSQRNIKLSADQVAALMQGTPASQRAIEAWELWQDHLVSVPPPELEIKTAQEWRSLLAQAKRDPDYEEFLHVQIRKWVEEEKLPPGLIEADLLPVATDDISPANLENYLYWNEALHLLGSLRGLSRAQKLKDLKSREQRRRLFELRDNRAWVLLRGISIPPSWDQDLADLLLQTPAELQQLDTNRLLGLHTAEGKLHPSIVTILDERMQLGPEKTVESLLKAKCWLNWRLQSRIPPNRSSAREWLFQSPDRPRLEDWRTVIQDLAVRTDSKEGKPEFGLSGADIQGLRKRFKNQFWPFPSIELFENEQAWDLVRVCCDLHALAELQESFGPDKPLLQNSVFAQQFPEGTLAWLTEKPVNPPPLTLLQAEELFTLSGERRNRAAVPLAGAVMEKLLEDTGAALAAADRTQLWKWPEFQAQLANWLCDRSPRPDDPAQRELLEILDGKVPEVAAPVIKRDQELARLAEPYVEHGLRRLGEFLWPLFGDQAIYAQVITALSTRDHQSPVWKTLIARVQNRTNAKIDQHPLIGLAHTILNLEKGRWKDIAKYGWPTLIDMLRSEKDSIYLLYPCAEYLPVLVLAAVLRNDAGLGAVGAGVLLLPKADSFFEHSSWWIALFRTLPHCQRRSSRPRRSDRIAVALQVVLNAYYALQNDPYNIKGADTLFDSMIQVVEAQALPSQSTQVQGAPA